MEWSVLPEKNFWYGDRKLGEQEESGIWNKA